jgi:hypothetical protein
MKIPKMGRKGKNYQDHIGQATDPFSSLALISHPVPGMVHGKRTVQKDSLRARV